MSGLGQGCKGAGKLALLDQERCFSADMLLDPEVGWPVTENAPLAPDDSNVSPNIRVFSKSKESGAGFFVRIPERATAMRFRVRGRSRNPLLNDESRVVLRLYTKGNEGWSGPSALGVISVPTGGIVHDTKFAITLSGIRATADCFTHFLITRSPGKTDNLVGAYLLHEVGLNFIVG